MNNSFDGKLCLRGGNISVLHRQGIKLETNLPDSNFPLYFSDSPYKCQEHKLGHNFIHNPFQFIIHHPLHNFSY